MTTAQLPRQVDQTPGRRALPLRAIRRRRQPRGEIPPFRGLLPLLVLLVTWQLVQKGQSSYFPRPSLWWDGIKAQEQAGALWPAFFATLRTFVFALLISTALGSILGMAIGVSRFLDRVLGPFLDYCRFMPAAAVVPIAVLFAGYTERMKLIVVVFCGLWPILLQVRASLRAQSPLLMDVARSLHLSRSRRVIKVLLPSLTPAIILGVRVAAPLLLIIVLLVEIVTQVQGLGGLISNAQRSFDSATAFGILAIAGALGIAINLVVTAAESWFLRYRPHG